MGKIVYSPNTLSIWGSGPNAADAALRTVLKSKENSGPAIIIDYTGRGALVLNETNKMGLLKCPVYWYDLADRLRPISLLHLKRSPHFRQIASRVLGIMRKVSNITILDTTIAWAVEAAYNLTSNGAVGLGALFRTLASPETRRWFLTTQKDPHDLAQLLKMLSWTLRFPSVYAMSESINRPDLAEKCRAEGVVWIECRTEYFERCEHQLICGIVEAVVEDSVKSILCDAGKSGPSSLTVLHLFPLTSITPGMPEWVKETAGPVKHIAVHSLHSANPLPCAHKAWAAGSASIWVVGKVQPLKKAAHSAWLHDGEIDRINGLDNGNVWVKSNDSGKALVANIRLSEEPPRLAYRLRQNSARIRKIAQTRQMASNGLPDSSAGGEAPTLYNKLCEIETLRLGWLRVKEGRKDSCGADRVTIAAFREKLDEELTRLSHELGSREYRCRPLRRVQLSKPDGGKRDLGISCVRDRVVQAACLLLMEPVFEPTFSHYSFAFRPRRSARQALSVVRSMISAGRRWAVIADIRKCFDTIDHDVLLRLLSARIGDQRLLKLIRHWLTVDVVHFAELLPVSIGLPQGESLSPLLANIYLDPLDKHFENLGLSFVRYADDIVILTGEKDEAETALRSMEHFLLEPLHLQLKPAKTLFTEITAGMDYLGFHITLEDIEVKSQKMDEAQKMLSTQIKELGHSVSTLNQRAGALMRINAIIRGWRNYFVIPDEQSIAAQAYSLDKRVDQMAEYYLPQNIRGDPAWICRERFYPSSIEDIESEKESIERAIKTGSGYPQEKTADNIDRWVIEDKPDDKGANKTDDEREDATPSVEDPDLDGAVIKDGDRLYVLSHGSYLSTDDHDIIIKKQKTVIYSRPLNEIGLVYLQGFGINISVNLHIRLAELDIPAVFAPPVGEPIAVLNSATSSKAYLRRLQVVRREDQDVICAGLNMLSAKIGNQAAVLRYFSKYKKISNPGMGATLTKTAVEIRHLAENIRKLDPAAEGVRTIAMGIEGHAAALYWRAVISMIPEEFSFSGRVKRGAKDPVNQCVNYVYGILYGEVWRAVMKAGLDPYFGIIHGSMRDQGSLVFDMIEEFRAPFADRLVIGMVGRGFRPSIGAHGYLKTKTRRQLASSFVKSWGKKISWRSKVLDAKSLVPKQADNLAKLMKGEGDYHPYRMRW
ncbi:MAG: group II intron reverse transcriptase/maturase [Nitrospiraceae bacterium]|nr:group II intron reverse transcriptase/maturase [Nitrospiraceae bacterium]